MYTNGLLVALKEFPRFMYQFMIIRREIRQYPVSYFTINFYLHSAPYLIKHHSDRHSYLRLLACLLAPSEEQENGSLAPLRASPVNSQGTPVATRWSRGINRFCWKGVCVYTVYQQKERVSILLEAERMGFGTNAKAKKARTAVRFILMEFVW